MRLKSLTLLVSLGFFIASCQQATTSDAQESSGNKIARTIPVEEYEQKLGASPNAQLIDVRTPQEYAEGHLKDAVNMDINNTDFDKMIGKLNKDKPVFVYCLAGSRSAQAVDIMKGMGFKEVYNLAGGIMKWERAGKPVTAGEGTTRPKGMTVAEFNELINKRNYVLVDYNAPWCVPCKKMLPYIERLAEKDKDRLILVKIDADDNKDLLAERNIQNIPYLELYLDGKLVWKHEGYIEEADLLKETKL